MTEEKNTNNLAEWLGDMTEENKICIKCQECCRWLNFIVDPSVIEAFGEVYRVRGCVITMLEGANAASILVPSVCPHLGVLGCRIYKQRPNYCRTYDARHDPFMQDRCKLPQKEGKE